MIRKLFVLVACVAASGCTSTAFKEIGVPPTMSKVGSGIEAEGYSLYDYPEKPARPLHKFSVWDDRQARLFTDARALDAGDVLTVLISINDRAKLKNDTNRNRTAKRTLGLGASYDVDGVGDQFNADGKINSQTDTQGTAATDRSEAINLAMAAVVTRVLPNGNLLISGSQEVRVNAELRILTIAGIVRPVDIGPRNTISYDRIAEARVSYGGRGRLTEVQQPPYGQQLIDIVSPF
ncbi:flagellar basal body L-ring protein FlgH [Mesorhizobium sp. BAC0120]|uniref:flagellar basal body L-ring protein FlgH n=1 Tax=Mesorhizobium sp. BAC0120 TaxID=3090670 RepID=UPI00298CDB7E|nr:flagellar basal body L-ring protein FlgH [Mesorhizobium sp. BAC0120]MDW6024439.1 flagellar basal body L-ring protein FlgH [Mesorhizobium sp. BAC0120]